MTRQGSRRWSITTLAVLIAASVVGSAGIAWGYWTVAASESTTASAATVGISVTGADALSTVYSSALTATAAPVTVTNLSSREMPYTLALSADGDPELASTVLVALGKTPTCTVDATLNGGPSTASMRACGFATATPTLQHSSCRCVTFASATEHLPKR